METMMLYFKFLRPITLVRAPMFLVTLFFLWWSTNTWLIYCRYNVKHFPINQYYMLGLLICKYDPFRQEVSVESLILKWPLRPWASGFDMYWLDSNRVDCLCICISLQYLFFICISWPSQFFLFWCEILRHLFFCVNKWHNYLTLFVFRNIIT